MADHAKEIESDLVAKGQLGRSGPVQSFAVSAITESVAFLEALVNEIWQYAIDADAHSNPNLCGLEPTAIDLIRRLDSYGRLERWLSTLEKYDVVLACAGKPPLDVSRRPGQDFGLLVKLRNALSHYKPEMQWSNKVHRLEKQLSDLAPTNPLMQGTLPWFPDHPLCAGVAEWAWQRSREFTAAWQQSLGLTTPTNLEVEAR
jgi:hypothetical protein